MSATQMAQSVKETGNKLFNHLKVLEEFQLVTLVKVRKVRGANENLYVSNLAGNSKVEGILADTEADDHHVRRKGRLGHSPRNVANSEQEVTTLCTEKTG